MPPGRVDVMGFSSPDGVSSSRLQSDLVVDGSAKPLFAAEVTLRRFYGHVAQQELDLLQLAACGMA